MGNFLKYRAKQIFTGQQFHPGENPVLVLTGPGVVEAIVPASEAGEDVQELDGILCPGFVNAHCHIELSHLKNTAPVGLGMMPFLLTVIGQREAAAERVQQAIMDAEAEMLRNGIVAVGDICNTPNSFPMKLRSPIRFYNFIEVMGFVPATAAKRYEAAQQLYSQCRAFSPHCSVSPHAPYSVSPELFSLIFSQPQQVVTLHNQESEAEQAFFQSKTG
ncbi:MAG: amidohydrolase family protein, partial [Dinghuibacter sp.]|nr:amidohydrolase family protein [Dinghuibacter sp.]